MLRILDCIWARPRAPTWDEPTLIGSAPTLFHRASFAPICCRPPLSSKTHTHRTRALQLPCKNRLCSRTPAAVYNDGAVFVSGEPRGAGIVKECSPTIKWGPECKQRLLGVQARFHNGAGKRIELSLPHKICPIKPARQSLSSFWFDIKWWNSQY